MRPTEPGTGSSTEGEPAPPAARAGDPEENPAETEQAPERDLILLRLGEARFGIWGDEVLEVVRTPPLSRLPLASDEVPGVTSVRGEVIPVLDLGMRLLGAPAKGPGRLILARHHATDALVGMLVDAVETLLVVPEDEVRRAPEAAEASLPPELVAGVVVRDEGVVTVLHLGRALDPPGDTEEGVESK